MYPKTAPTTETIHELVTRVCPNLRALPAHREVVRPVAPDESALELCESY